MVDPFSGASLNNAVSPCNRESVIAVMKQPGMDSEEPRQRILRNGKCMWTNSERAVSESRGNREIERKEFVAYQTKTSIIAALWSIGKKLSHISNRVGWTQFKSNADRSA